MCRDRNITIILDRPCCKTNNERSVEIPWGRESHPTLYALYGPASFQFNREIVKWSKAESKK